jgi:hypothetical protein
VGRLGLRAAEGIGLIHRGESGLGIVLELGHRDLHGE